MRLGESAFVKSMQLLSYDPLRLFTRPIAGVLLVLAIVTVGYNLYQALRTSPSRKEPASS
jgi:hypothetical protein